MADLEKTISIIFGGKDNLSPTTLKIAGSIDSLSSGIEAAAQPLAKLADGVLAADAALTAFVAGGMALAYRESVRFEASAADLKKVLGDEAAALGAAKIEALELSDAYGKSASEIIGSMASFKQAGFDVQGAMTLTKDSLDLVIAGDIEAAKASEYLVSILKGFKAPASDARQVLDILNEVSNNYAVSVDQLAAGMAGLSPISKQMGFSFAETAGILTPVIEVFQSGDEAAMALKTGLLKLIDDSEPVKKALASIGVSQTDANGALRSGKDILADVAKAFGSLDENQKLFITSQLVGVEQSARMVEVFNNLSKTSEITATALNSAGSAAAEVAARMETSEHQINRFMVNLQNLGISIGDKFRDSATGVVSGMTEIERALKSAIDAGAFDPIFDAIVKFGDKARDFLTEVAAAVPEALEGVDFSGLIDSLGSLGDQVAEFFGALDLTDPEDLSKAMQGLIDTIESLVRITEGMAETFKPVWEAIKEGVSQVNNLDTESQKAFGNVLAASKLVVEAGAGIAAAVVAIGLTGADVGRIFDALVGSIRFAWNTLQTAFDQALKIITGAVMGVSGAVSGLADMLGMDGLAKSMADLAKSSADLMEAINADQMEQMEEAASGFDQAMAGITGSTDQATKSAKALTDQVAQIPEEKPIGISIEATGSDADEVRRILSGESELLNDGQVEKQIDVSAKVEVDQASIDKANEVLKQDIPESIKVQAQIDIARIDAQAAVIQDSLKFKAEVDIAALEAGAESIKAIADSTAESFQASTDIVSDMASLLATLDTGSSNWIRLYKTITEQMDAENALRAEQLDIERTMVEAQAAYMQAKTEALKSGKPLIQIDGTNMEPALQELCRSFIEKVQIFANEYESDFLMGMIEA